jgi:hypothetical protein
MFYPKPNIPYKLVFQEIKNDIVVESYMIITFTEQNNVYKKECRFGFTHYECYDKDIQRFICYVNAKSVFLNSATNTNSDKINSFSITKIFLEDEIV